MTVFCDAAFYPLRPGRPAWAGFAATALGLMDAHAGDLEKVLIRYERDFGWVLQDMETEGPPRDYQERVVRAEEEICARLEAEGFQVRQGEIEAV